MHGSPILSAPETLRIPGIREGESAPWFAEPWQAKAVALTVSLHAAGVFAWSEWAEALSARLHGDVALPDSAASAAHVAQYYTAWLGALEEMVARAGLADADAIRAATDTWQRAALATPHGTPILYERGLGSD